jgi:hypothetical protein
MGLGLAEGAGKVAAGVLGFLKVSKVRNSGFRVIMFQNLERKSNGR